MAVSSQTVVILLSESKHWDDWYEVVRSTAVRKGVSSLIDVKQDVAPTPLRKLVRPLLTAANAAAASFSDLDATQQLYYKMLLAECKDNVWEFDRRGRR